jgi:RNA polymerase sigma-70 factor, ECF subfamily
MQDDAELCCLAQQGDLTAAATLVDRHYARVYAYLRRLAGNELEAEDLTQKTFFRVWVSLSSFEGRSRFSTWLHQLAYRTYVDWLRGRRPAESAPDSWWNNLRANEPDPSLAAEDRDLAQRTYAEIDRLDDRLRQAVHLHYYQGLTLAETAEVLGVSAGTVKNRLRETLDHLRRRLVEPLAQQP